jgi:hypothetical protein
MIEEKAHLYEIENKKLEIEIEEKRWRSCCFDIHQESSLFFAKLCISLSIIALSSYQLISLHQCEYQSLYSSLISTVLTYWLSRK